VQRSTHVVCLVHRCAIGQQQFHYGGVTMQASHVEGCLTMLRKEHGRALSQNSVLLSHRSIAKELSLCSNQLTSLHAWFTAAPLASSSCTTAVWPLEEAKYRGVQPPCGKGKDGHATHKSESCMAMLHASAPPSRSSRAAANSRRPPCPRVHPSPAARTPPRGLRLRKHR
jgi:hypothetical protein